MIGEKVDFLMNGVNNGVIYRVGKVRFMFYIIYQEINLYK